MDKDKIADIALSIVDRFVESGLCPDCTDTDNDTEFRYQDIIREEIERVTNG